MKIIRRLFLLPFLFLYISCNPQGLDCVKETKYGKFKYCENDLNTISDLIRVCDEKLLTISSELNLQINDPVIIEVYPNQEEYSRNIMNPGLKESPAISGNGIIQIVSPKSKIKTDSIKYEDRLMFLVHEYIHILIDKLNNTPPIFIDEGIASYYSSFAFYKSSAQKYVKQINFIPTIEQLKNHYYKLPAPDLFSFLFIDFIVELEDKSILREILRHPEMIDKDELNDKWQRFIEVNYY